jgi:hypothetical protein
MIDGGSHLKSAPKLSNEWGPPLIREDLHDMAAIYGNTVCTDHTEG